MPNIIFSEGSGLNDALYGNWQAPLQAVIMKRAEAFEQKSLYKKIFKTVNSTHFGESYTGMTSMAGFKPGGENAEAPIDGFQQTYDKLLKNVRWQDTFAISREMIADSMFVEMKRRPEAFVTGFYRTQEEFAACLLGTPLDGSSTSVAFGGWTFDCSCADGQPLFDTAHPSKTGGTAQSNNYADALTAETLGELETKMQNFTDDNGKILTVAPNTIIIPNDADTKNAAFKACGSEKDPITANNSFNYQVGRWNIIVWPYLNAYVDGGDSPWILFDPDYNELNYGAIWQEREPLEIDSYVDRKTKANVWDGFARFTAGFHDWRAFACGGIAGATSL